MAARKPFLLRLNPALHKELRAWAEQEMRSLNAQIEYLLRQALMKRGAVSAEEDPPREKSPRPEE